MACVIGGESDPCNSTTGWATASDGKGPYDTARMSAISVGAMACIRVRAPSLAQLFSRVAGRASAA